MTRRVVYAIHCTETGRVKLGRTRNLQSRFEAVRAMSPTVLELLVAFDGGPESEVALHQHFAEYRLRGEWFELPKEEVERLRAGIFPAGARQLLADAHTRKEKQEPLRCLDNWRSTIHILAAGANTHQRRAERARERDEEAAS